MKILATGGAGFIGSAVCRHLIRDHGCAVVQVDKLTYVASLSSLDEISSDALYSFEQANVADAAAMKAIFASHRPDGGS